MAIEEEFRAIFRGGVGPTNNIKCSLVKCRILTGNRSEYKEIGPKKLSSLWNGDWHPGPTHLKDEPFIPYDMYVNEDYVTIRIYNFSLEREPYIEKLEQSTLNIENKQLRLKLQETEEMLATALSATKDTNLEDRRKLLEKENAEHYKDVRSKLSYVDSIGGFGGGRI